MDGIRIDVRYRIDVRILLVISKEPALYFKPTSGKSYKGLTLNKVGYEVGDPEQMYQNFTKHVSNFKEFLMYAGAEGNHTALHADCGGCKKVEATLRLVGGDKMES